jgi:8-oxo-dGTP pyrophosphatase MutT (NUDIX family)
MVTFDERLRSTLSANLQAHPRREQPLDGRRHAAVAVVLMDSDRERDDGPLPAPGIDPAVVTGDRLGRPLATRLTGLAGGASFLICRRPSRMRRHAGQWALPGGRVDGSETPLDAVLRELDEEVGLRLGPDSVVGWLDDYVSRSGFVITPVVLWCEDDPVLAPDPDEVLAAFRVGLHALLDGEPRYLDIPESDRPVLQVPLGTDLIHAPTGAVLLQFREVALRGRIGERVDQVEEPVFAWR